MNDERWGTFSGYVWEIGHEERQSPATLHWEPNDLRVDVMDDGSAPWSVGNKTRSDTRTQLHGRFLGPGEVTLCDCLQVGGSSNYFGLEWSELAVTKFHVQTGYIGILLDADDLSAGPRFHQVGFRPSYLAEWIAESGVDFEYLEDVTKITYRIPQSLTWTFGDIEFTIAFEGTIKHGLHTNSVAERVTIILKSVNARTIDQWLADIIGPYLAFQYLAVGSIPNMELFQIYGPSQIPDLAEDMPYEVVVPFEVSSDRPFGDIIHTGQLLVFDRSGQGFQKQFQAWLDAWDQVADVAHLYESARMRGDGVERIEMKFLFAAQAAEVLHARRYHRLAMPLEDAKQIREQVIARFEDKDVRRRLRDALAGLERLTFLEALQDLFKDHESLLRPFFPELPILAEQIKHSRNYYVHYPQALAAKKMGPLEMMVATDALVCVLTAALLEIVGIEREIAHSYVRQIQPYHSLRHRHRRS